MTTALQGKNILLGISGGIASYKSAILARRLIDAGADVRVVMTQGAQAFITPLTFQALTGNPVHTDLLDTEAEAAMGHIELARWADCVLIAPASANVMARIAHGMADDLLTTLCLATDAPIALAPAMNHLMWSNAATQDNLATLISRGVTMIGPDSGDQACGEVGEGRMSEPDAIIDELAAADLTASRSSTAPTPKAKPAKRKASTPAVDAEAPAPAVKKPAASATKVSTALSTMLRGKTFVITAGPTVEAIDPVRFISNKSSGKMGFALANAAEQMGADVVLIAGPVDLETPEYVQRVDVKTAGEMLDATLNAVKAADVFISVAAVADYRMAKTHYKKIKKSEADIRLTLVPNPDILKTVSELRLRPFCVGFAAETNDVEENAKRKLKKKKLDMIAANHVGKAEDPVFGSDTNALTVYWGDQSQEIAKAPKSTVAEQLLLLIAAQLNKKN